MNRPRPRAHIRVRAPDPLLRSQIVERLEGLGEISVEVEASATGAAGNGTQPVDADVESSTGEPFLTPRETEVLGLLAEGLANKEIAARLSFSAHTAKYHVESILRKLDAANRAEAVKEGIRRGLIGL
ncbi:MAG: LuxR C-terminal-related transcriptional regulator [Spirochaetia bacterium]|jgi:DNA-binding CsgD family transcriptional regulator